MYKYLNELFRPNPYLAVDQLRKEAYVIWAPAEDVQLRVKPENKCLFFKLPFYYEESVLKSWVKDNGTIFDVLSDPEEIKHHQTDLTNLFVH